MDCSPLTVLPPEAVVFWSGAGISVDRPTRGPQGNLLTARALASYFLPDVSTHLRQQYEELAVPNAEFRPRLETVLDVLAGVYGTDILADVLSDLIDAPANPNHAFFARHLAVGGWHLTANFDTCIEAAAAGDSLVLAPRCLVHFHGALGAKPDHAALERLGARLSVIENGFPEDVIRRLDTALGRPETQALVFVGYSGSDFFDVRPYLRERGFAQLRGKTVVWLQYSETAEPNRTGAAADLGHLGQAREAGVNTVLLTGPLTQLTGELEAAWQLPPAAAGTASDERERWHQRVQPTAQQRTAATAVLYGRMGFHQRVIELLGDSADLDADQHEMLGHSYWGTG